MKSIIIDIPETCRKVLNILNEANFASYVVGGCIRDTYLGLTPKDWDITTNATPEQVEQLFKDVIPTGRKYGTMTVKIEDDSYEVTTFRYDSEVTDGRRPESVTFGQSILDDLQRRDFTINAMAYNDLVGLVDPFEGLEDLKYKIIRTVGNPKDRFKEDGLRVLRALRFAVKYNFEIEDECREEIRNGSSYIKNLSVERITSELNEILKYIEDYNLIDLYKPLFDTIFETEFPDTYDKPKLLKLNFKETSLYWKFYKILSLRKSMWEAEAWLRKYKFSNNFIKTIINYYKITEYAKDRGTIPKLSDIDARKLLSKVPYDSVYSYYQDYKKLNYFSELLFNNKDCPITIHQLAISGWDLIVQGYNVRKIDSIKSYLLENYVLIDPSLNTKEKLIEILRKEKENKNETND